MARTSDVRAATDAGVSIGQISRHAAFTAADLEGPQRWRRDDRVKEAVPVVPVRVVAGSTRPAHPILGLPFPFAFAHRADATALGGCGGAQRRDRGTRRSSTRGLMRRSWVAHTRGMNPSTTEPGRQALADPCPRLIP